jgi:ABC-type branched-subunit amino acid transport system substrate-binding protein
MTTSTILLDPTSERVAAERQLLPRLASLAGMTVGLLDISKPRGQEFLDEVEKALQSLGATVKRYTKPTFTRVAPTELNQRISTECDAVIEGLAD